MMSYARNSLLISRFQRKIDFIGSGFLIEFILKVLRHMQILQISLNLNEVLILFI